MRGRLVGLVLLGAIAFLGGVAPPVEANSYHWYGRDNRTCWQVGFPGPFAENCVWAGNNYLHQTDSTGKRVNVLHAPMGGFDYLLLRRSGEFCGYTRIGAHLDRRDSSGAGIYTGFSPNSTPGEFYNDPQGDFQVGNSRGDVCQTLGTRWGQFVRGDASNKNCSAEYIPCAIQHYSSFGGQGTNLKPWSPDFGPYPSLNVSLQAEGRMISRQSGGGGWGFVCPQLKQINTSNVVEFCFEEFGTNNGFPRFKDNPTSAELNDPLPWKQYDNGVACQSYYGYNFDQVIVKFNPSTRNYATQRPGTWNSFTWSNNAGLRRFHATISRADFRRVVERINMSHLAQNPADRGCSRGASTDPSHWALIGVEHGIEGGYINYMGANHANLELFTSTDMLNMDESMWRGQRITSMNGRYAAVMQNDGNFVVYDGGTPIWTSGSTYGSNDARVVMQRDGNLVIYNTANHPIWSTGTFTAQPHPKSVLVMQNDGALVVLQNGIRVWGSR